MKTTIKNGRKIIGALVSAAVMVSMIPAMVFAVPAPQTETVTITLDSIEGHQLLMLIRESSSPHQETVSSHLQVCT